MKTEVISTEPTSEITEVMKFTRRDWQIIPHTTRPDCFNLKETKTDKILGTFTLPKDGDTTLLNLIASAPELKNIAEMYHDHMLGNQAEKSNIFSIVCEVLINLQ